MFDESKLINTKNHIQNTEPEKVNSKRELYLTMVNFETRNAKLVSYKPGSKFSRFMKNDVFDSDVYFDESTNSFTCVSEERRDEWFEVIPDENAEMIPDDE